MEKLPVEFKGRGEVSGVMFYQLFRHESLCLYRRVEAEGDQGYEVIKAIENKEADYILSGKKVHVSAKETYPKAERWGTTERGTRSLVKAIDYFNQIAAYLGYAVTLTKEMLQTQVSAAL